MIASSSFMPPVRAVCAATMPLIETTAASVAPPPRSTTMFPLGVATGRGAPQAGAPGAPGGGGPLGHLVIGDHAVAQRAHDLDAIGRAPVHVLGLLADGDDFLFGDGDG